MERFLYRQRLGSIIGKKSEKHPGDCGKLEKIFILERSRGNSIGHDE
jgi:hypothetical protein